MTRNAPPANDSEPSPTRTSDALVPICTACPCFCHDLHKDASNRLILPDACEHLGFNLGVDAQSASSADLAPLKNELLAAIRLNKQIAISGLESLPLEAQKLALTIAENAGAWVIPGSGSTGYDPWTSSFVQQGKWLATWSEIRARSDALLLWFLPVWQSHPRWIERFGPKVHHAHKLAVIAPETEVDHDSWIDDQLIRLEPAQANHFLTDLRLALRDKMDQSGEPTDGRLRRLVHLFRNFKWLTVLHADLPDSIVDPTGLAESFTAMIAEQNSAEQRVVTADLTRSLNAPGLKSIVAWRAGTNLPAHFSPEGPVFRPDEITHADFELVLAFGPEPADWLHRCENAQVFWFNSSHAGPPPGGEDRVHALPVAHTGFDASGTVVRGDGVTIRVPATYASSRPSAHTILTELLQAIQGTSRIRSITK